MVGADWKRNEHMPEEMFCDEFILSDLRLFENCAKVLEGCDHCFNLAADMGGMGFIQSNHSVIFYNNMMISFNMVEAGRVKGVKIFLRVFGVHLPGERAVGDGLIRGFEGSRGVAGATARRVRFGKVGLRGSVQALPS